MGNLVDDIIDGIVQELTSKCDDLRRQIRELIADVDHMAAQAGPDSCADYMKRNAALTAQNAALRDGLNGALRWLQCSGDDKDRIEQIGQACDIIYRALANATKEG
jgi:hypothetical protein